MTGRPWTGITPKFTVKDARGHTYLLKLDPIVAPELPSSVEIICTKIFHAIGYWVPEDYLMDLESSRLQIAEGALFRTENGYKQPIQMVDVEHWLKDAPRKGDGTIRVVASRFIPGRVVGQYRYYGTRPDDPNDVFPHERRRELRGLRVFGAWLNHDDARSLNSLDTYMEVNGKHQIPALLPGLRLDAGKWQHVGAAATRRIRVPARERRAAQRNGDVRFMEAGLGECEVSRFSLRRKL